MLDSLRESFRNSVPTHRKKAGTDAGVVRRRRRSTTSAGPSFGSRREKVKPATIDAVAERLLEAFEHVSRNKGAPGPDGQTIDEVRKHLDDLLPELRAALLEGYYQPGVIRRKWIVRAGGGKRGLGIPNVIDRMVQEAIRPELDPLFEVNHQRLMCRNSGREPVSSVFSFCNSRFIFRFSARPFVNGTILF